MLLGSEVCGEKPSALCWSSRGCGGGTGWAQEQEHLCPPPASGLGPIHMSEVRCTGHERSLGECRFQDAEQSGCRHEDDAAVRCHVPHMDFQSQVSPCLPASTC